MTTQNHTFQAETARLLQLMVHSVYSDRDVFLRELISNASDACERLRYEAQTTPGLLDETTPLCISIIPDAAAKTLTLTDTGIGMSHDEMVANLGTIARSGTRAFMEEASNAPGAKELIGQFGIGFYAAFMVADQVDVISRRAGAPEVWTWHSDGVGSFTMSETGEIARGTRIVLHLRDDALEFLEPQKIERVVKAWSDPISLPIFLDTKGEVPRQLNSGTALWMRGRTDVDEAAHTAFFGELSGSYAPPALTIHYKVEGRQNYTVLLYVPGQRPFDLYEPERTGRQKLYVRRVFITDTAALLPAWLRFVRGVIDSEDMPLNLSREMLQHNPQMTAIRKAVTNRVLTELKNLSGKDKSAFAKIWALFGAVIKEGLCDDPEHRARILELCLFDTSTRTAINLKDYVADLKPDQKAIYYLTAQDKSQAARVPQAEGFRARNLEVLYLTDPVDAFWVRMVPEFEGHPLKSLAAGSADLDTIAQPTGAEATPHTASAEGMDAFVAGLKASLGDAVGDVKISKTLTQSPVCLVADIHGPDRMLQKLMAGREDMGANFVPAPVLEINATHPLIAALASQAVSARTADLATTGALLLDMARILEGDPVSDPQSFVARIGSLLEGQIKS